MLSLWSRRSLLRWAALGALTGPSLRVPVARAQSSATAYKLGSGDKVRVTVFNEKDLSGDFDVSDQGLLALPLIGQVRVTGLTLSETQDLITQKYGKDYLVNPRVNV